MSHLEAFLPHLDAWQQEQRSEKDCLWLLLTYIADGYRSLGDAEKERELLERVLAINERQVSRSSKSWTLILSKWALIIWNSSNRIPERLIFLIRQIRRNKCIFLQSLYFQSLEIIRLNDDHIHG
jgi:hypothetical protein